MERKIGEIFEYIGAWYQCIENIYCENCAFKAIICDEIDDIVGPCSTDLRRDGKSVVFKKLEKVGGPCKSLGLAIQNGVIIELYKTYTKAILPPNVGCILNDYLIAMEIKNKEDMETTEHSNSENIGKNLKAFDLQAAKSGKPVCTRDGRKARIICFDKVDNTINKPIVALVTYNDGQEYSNMYYSNGKYNTSDDNLDLMMLPEKKEGWAVIRRSDIYENEEQAREALLDSYAAMMIRKITWEE